MSNMSKSNRNGNLWLSPLLEDDPARDGPRIPNTGHRSAHHGLVATCEDALQGTYMVEASSGAHWLVAKGADDNFDIISRPDQTTGVPSDGRIIAAVKVYITRNER
jgi:hypothetical protein